MLAPIIPGDSDLEAWRKAITVATYIDILISRRVWSGSSTDYNTMQYAMFLVVKDIRNKPPGEVAGILKAKLDAEPMPFANSMRFGLLTANKKTVRRFLARLTTWLDRRFGHGNNLSAYLVTAGAQGYDIEHIMPDNYDLYRKGYPSEPEFTEQRNRIGALLLLPKSFNRSYGGMPYEEKSLHYLSQNSLAQTLRAEIYSNNPGLGRVRFDDAIPFEPFGHFGRAELEVREKAINALAERVWSSDRVLTASTVEVTS